MAFQVKILKGSRKIGGCITEISTDSNKIIIDFGEDLPDDDNKVKSENPNIVGLTCGKSIYDAVFITHSHGDHIGLIHYVNEDIPVYVEPVSKRIYERLSSFTGKVVRSETVDMNFEEKIVVGDISVIPYFVDHSSYNSCMLLVESAGKRILHTGDFRSHGFRGNELDDTLKRIGHVDMVITEGTTLNREDKDMLTEEDLSKKAREIFEKYDQVFILQSSTNIDRVCSFYEASKNTSKTFIEDLFTSNITCILEDSSIPNPKEYDDVYTWIPVKYMKKSENFKSKYLYEYKEFSKQKSYMNKKYTLMVKSSMVNDIKKLYDKGYITNACLIYSMWDGYKNKEEINNFIENIKEYGINDVIVLHTSGHADRKALSKLNDLSPTKVLPIHTTNPEELKSLFGDSVYLVKDGEMVEI